MAKQKQKPWRSRNHGETAAEAAAGGGAESMSKPQQIGLPPELSAEEKGNSAGTLHILFCFSFWLFRYAFRKCRSS
jgi:hypothetical protein